MFKSAIAIVLLAVLAPFVLCDEKDFTPMIKKAVQRSTLNQPGTKPFHLKAVVAPSLERERSSGRTGEIEIWWSSPTTWRREVRCPEFHQIDIINGSQEWQKNEGDYFPEWLREVAVELIDPVPYLSETLQQADGADVRRIAGMIHFGWIIDSSNGQTQMGMGGALAIMENTGLLFYGGGFGWGGLLKDYQDFHRRMVARTVSHGTPEVTAKVTVLEDLGPTPSGFLDASAPSGDAQLLKTVLVAELNERKNLIHDEPITWPTLRDGPLEGGVTTQVCIDRVGKVREMTTIVAQNQGVTDVARQAIAAMQFKPYLENGVPAQVITRITLGFKTVRPPAPSS